VGGTAVGKLAELSFLDAPIPSAASVTNAAIATVLITSPPTQRFNPNWQYKVGVFLNGWKNRLAPTLVG
jgi:hypothetical protein